MGRNTEKKLEKEQLVLKTVSPGATKHLYFSVFVISLSSLNAGTAIGYSSAAIESMDKNGIIKENSSEESWMTSLTILGCFASCFPLGIIMEKFGRRYALILSCLPPIAGWLLIACAQNVIMVYIGRFITGFSYGLLITVAPPYLAEISPPEIRGRMGIFPLVAVSSGMLGTTAIGLKTEWQYIASIAAGSAAISSVFNLFVPESPYWLIQRNNRKDAIDVLAWLRGPYVDVSEECDMIENAAVCSKLRDDDLLNEVFRATSLKPLLMGFILILLIQFSGIVVVSLYLTSIFASSGSQIDPLTSTVIVNAINIPGVLCPVLFIDKAGRRPALFVSTLVMGVSLLLLAGYFKYSGEFEDGRYSWVPIASVVLYCTGYNMGCGSVPFVLISELMPTRTRGFAVTFLACFGMAAVFGISKTFNMLRDAISDSGVFVMCSGVCFTVFVYSFVVIPETKGKTFGEIEEYFKNGNTFYLVYLLMNKKNPDVEKLSALKSLSYQEEGIPDVEKSPGYQNGATSYVDKSATYQDGGIPDLEKSPSYQTGASSYVENLVTYQDGGIPDVEKSPGYQNGVTSYVEKSATYQDGGILDLEKSPSYQTGAIPDVEKSSGYQNGSTSYVEMSTTNQNGGISDLEKSTTNQD